MACAAFALPSLRLAVASAKIVVFLPITEQVVLQALGTADRTNDYDAEYLHVVIATLSRQERKSAQLVAFVWIISLIVQEAL